MNNKVVPLNPDTNPVHDEILIASENPDIQNNEVEVLSEMESFSFIQQSEDEAHTDSLIETPYEEIASKIESENEDLIKKLTEQAQSGDAVDNKFVPGYLSFIEKKKTQK